MILMHATCVAVDGEGVLLRGPSGAGKSDLALRLIDAGHRLVADDQVELHEADGRLMARAPAALANRMEVRGVGIVEVPATDAPVSLIIDLVEPAAVPRLPDAVIDEVAGVALPVVRLTPFEAAAPAKVRAALRRWGSGPAAGAP